MLVFSQHMDLELDQYTIAILHVLEENQGLVAVNATDQQVPVMVTRLVFTAALTISVCLHTCLKNHVP